MSNDLIHLLVILVPSALFLLLLVFGLVFGVMRGFRKSLILGIQALVAFAIVFTLFLIFIFTDPDGTRVVSAANTFMGEGGLQSTLGNAFGVSLKSSSTSLKEILLELIPKKMEFKDVIVEIIVNHGAYIMVLVNIAIKIVYAVVAAILYLILVFIFYIIYAIFYPERRHRRRIEKKYERLERDKPYKKRRLLGLLLGTVRGFVSGLLIISFVGAFLFMATGTNGNQKYEQVEWDNKDFEQTYNLYKAIGSYGETGIYKVLGAIENKDHIPYYLYLTEMLFNGKITDPERGLDNQNVWLVDEVGAYSKFANDILDLVDKYAHNELNALLTDPENKDNMVKLTEKFQNKDFQAEFDKIIDDFDAKVYFANFALSVLDSVAVNIDQIVPDMDETLATILQIMFKKGYLCEEIEDEKADIGKADYTVRPYLKASAILEKDDVKLLLKSALQLVAANLGKFTSGQELDIKTILNVIDQAIPTLQELSVLQDRRNDEVNGVFERIYQYMDKVIYKNISKNNQNNQKVAESQRLLSEAGKNSGVNWAKEIKNLLSTAREAIKLANNVLPDSMEGVEVLPLILDVFQKPETREANIASFDIIKSDFEKSKVLGLALSTSYLQDLLIDAVKEFAPDLYISPATKFNTEYNAAGEVVQRGEIYYLLDSAEQVLKDAESVNAIKTLINTKEELKAPQILEAVGILTKNDANGNNALLTLVNSQILRAFASAALTKLDADMKEISLYLPDDVYEVENGEKVNIIKLDELKIVAKNISSVAFDLAKFLDEDDAENYLNANLLLNNEQLPNLLDSKIVEGTASLTVKDLLEKMNQEQKDKGAIEMFYIPERLETIENWLTVKDASGNITRKGEIRIILDSVKASGVDVGAIIKEAQKEDGDIIGLVIDELTDPEKTDEQILALLDSQIVEGSVAKVLKNTLEDLNEERVSKGQKPIAYIPGNLSTVEAWLSTSTKEGEVKAIVRGVRASGFDFNGLMTELNKPEAEQDLLNFVLDEVNRLPYEQLAAIFNSVVVEGTFSQVLKSTLEDINDERAEKGELAIAYIPADLQTVEGWLSTPTKDGEVKVILKGLKESEFDLKGLLNVITNEEDSQVIIDFVLGEFDKYTMAELDSKFFHLFDSRVLEGTFSQVIKGTLDDINSERADKGELDIAYIPADLANIEGWLSTAEKEGEIKLILRGLKASDFNLNGLITTLNNAGDDSQAVIDFVLDEFNKYTLAELDTKFFKLFNSRVLEGTFSLALKSTLETINNDRIDAGEPSIAYIPEDLAEIEDWLSTAEKDGEVKTILRGLKASEFNLKDLINLLNDSQDSQEIIDFVLDEFGKYTAAELDSKFFQLFNSRVLEGTFSLALKSTLEDINDKREEAGQSPIAYIPANLKKVEGWLSTAEKDGEIKTILRGLKLSDFNLKGLMTELNKDEDKQDVIGFIFDEFDKYTVDELDTKFFKLLNSVVLEGTFSQVLKGTLEQINLDRAAQNLTPLAYIPEDLAEVEGWLSTSAKDGEVKTILRGLKESGFNLRGLLDKIENDEEHVLDFVLDELNDHEYEQLAKIFTSKVIEGTFSLVVKTKLEEIYDGKDRPIAYFPEDLAEIEGWLSTSEKDGEIKILLRGVKVSTFDLKGLLAEMDKPEDEQDLLGFILDEVDRIPYDNFVAVLDSRVLEGTLANTLINSFGDINEDQINAGGKALLYIPESLAEVEGWLTKEVAGQKVSELRTIVKAVKDSGIDIQAIVDEAQKPQDEQDLPGLLIGQIGETDLEGLELLLDSKVLEGTTALSLKNVFDQINEDQFAQGNYRPIYIPENLESIENWLTKDGVAGEIRSLIRGVKNSGVNIKDAYTDFTNAEGRKALLKVVAKYAGQASLTEENFAGLLESKVLHYTISYNMLNQTVRGLKIIVPYQYREAAEGDSKVTELVNVGELYNLAKLSKHFIASLKGKGISLTNIQNLDLDELLKVAEPLVETAVKYEEDIMNDNIILATTVYTILNQARLKRFIAVPNDLKALGSEANLLDFNQDDTWKKEIQTWVRAAKDVLVDGEGKADLSKATLIEKVKGLNSVSSVDPTKTKVDLCYESVVLKYTLTTKFEAVVKRVFKTQPNQGYALAVINAVKVQDEDHLEDTQYNFISKEELSNYVDILNQFDIQIVSKSTVKVEGVTIKINNLSGLDLDEIMDLAFTLNEPSITDPAHKTKLDVILTSPVIRRIGALKLDDILLKEDAKGKSIVTSAQLNSDLIKETITVGEEDFRVYRNSELAAVINSLEELGITKFPRDGFDFNDLTEKVLTLNNPSVVVDGNTKLDTLYSSYIIRTVVYDKVSDTLKNLVDAESLAKPAITETGSGLSWIKQEELANIITAAKTLDITDINNLKADEIMKKVVDLTSDDIHTIYQSHIIKLAIASKLYDNLKTLVDNAEDLHNAELYVTNDPETGLSFYKETEIKNLFDCLKTLDIDDVSSINTDAILDKVAELTDDDIDTLYTSYAMRLVLTKQIRDNVKTLVANEADLENANLYETDTYGLSYFTKAEVKGLIASIKVFDVKLNALNANVVKGKILTLTNAQVDTLYTSYIIKLALAKQLTTNVSDLVENADNLTHTELYVNDNGLGYYKDTEVKALIASLAVLGVTDLDNFNATSVKSKILTLTDAQIHTLYGSTIIKLALTKQLRPNLSPLIKTATDLDNTLISNVDTTVPGNTLKYFKEDEIKALLAGVEALEITNIDNFSADSVKDLNKLKTALPTLYQSYTVRLAITNQIIPQVTGLVEDATKLNSGLIQEANNGLSYVTLTEAQKIVAGLELFGVTNLSAFDASKVADKFLDFNTDKIATLYNSYTLRLVLTKQLKDNLAGKTENDAILAGDVLYDTADDTTAANIDLSYYKLAQVQALFTGIKELGVSELNNINLTAIQAQVLNLNGASTAAPARTKLDLLYDSMIIRYILAKNINDALTSQARAATLASDVVSTAAISTYRYYNQTEVAALINALGTLGITDINNTGSVDYAKAILNADVDKLYASTIVWDILYTKLSAILVANAVTVDHPLAKEEKAGITGIKFYKKAEITSIKTFMAQSGVADLSTFLISDVKLNATSIAAVGNSYILMGTISTNVVDNDSFTIPAETYDAVNGLIVKEDLLDLLTAISTFGEGALNNFNASSMTPNSVSANIGTIADSKIMRANITKSVTGTNVSVTKNAAYVEKTTDTAATPNNILVLTKDEVVNTVTGLKLLGVNDSFNVNSINLAALKGLTVANQKTVLQSNIITHVLTDVVISGHYNTAMFNVAINYGDGNYVAVASGNVTYPYKFQAAAATTVYSLNDGSEGNHNCLTADDILAFIYLLNNYTAVTNYAL